VAVTVVPTGPEAGEIIQYVALFLTTSCAVAVLPAASVAVSVHVPIDGNAAAVEVMAVRTPVEVVVIEANVFDGVVGDHESVTGLEAAKPVPEMVIVARASVFGTVFVVDGEPEP
jgi:hypothetical protein